MEQLSVIIIGLGNRGAKYALHMWEMPEKYKVVAIADPVPACREHVRKMFDLPDSACYEDWEEILAQPKMADVAVIAMSDHLHYVPALRAIEKGYHLLLEKPVAPTAQQCADIALAAERKGVQVLVCHVLRYTPFYGKIKELLMAGTIGQVISLDQVEAVGNVHFSHSFVRGKWHNEAESSPMLLAKSCHDLDIIQWLLDKPCTKVQSFGSLTHFTPENAPEGAPKRCADGGCPVGDTCPYNCVRHYYDEKKNHRRAIITNGISVSKEPTDEEVMEALRTRDYGLCVYQANNDVLDHQTVNMEFAGGATATLSVNAFNQGGRYIRIFGTKGEIYAFMADTEITVYTFEDKRKWTVSVLKTEESIVGGHGGGDQGIIRELHAYLSGTYTGFRAADINTSVRNHLIGFAAEEARHGETVMDMGQVYRRYGFSE